VRSRRRLASIAMGLVAIMAGLAGAELHCAFACRTSDATTAAIRPRCHETTADEATRLEGDQPCRNLDARVAAIEPSGAYRTVVAGAMAIARMAPPSPMAGTAPAVIGRDALGLTARPAPSILRI